MDTKDLNGDIYHVEGVVFVLYLLPIRARYFILYIMVIKNA